jgi:solute carrier family 45 protein 1/2/4
MNTYCPPKFGQLTQLYRPWTVAMWAPTTFLGIEVNKLSGGTEPTASYRRLSNESVEMTSMNGFDAALHLEHGPDEADATMKTSSTGELSGIYFGILNIYTTIPQFIGTFISTIVFAVMEPGKSRELTDDANPDEHHSATGPNAISVCMFIGAISATIAIFATRRLKYL